MLHHHPFHDGTLASRGADAPQMPKHCAGGRFGAAFFVVILVHLLGACLALLPPLSPYTKAPVGVISDPPDWLFALLMALWAGVAWALHLAGQRWELVLSADAMSAAACFCAGCVSFGFSCCSVHLGMIGSTALATIAAGLPPPQQTLRRHATSKLHRPFALLNEFLAIMAVCPCMLLGVATYLTLGRVMPSGAVNIAWRMANAHSTLPFAFACLGCLPLSATVASLRTRRVSAFLFGARGRAATCTCTEGGGRGQQRCKTD